MKKILALISSLFLASNNLFAIDYEKLAHKNTSAFIKQMRRERNLFLSGSGGGMMNDVESIFLSFDFIGSRSIDDARALYVEVADEFLARVNADEKLRPFLHNYPFTIDNFELHLTFVDKQKKFQPPLAFVFYSPRRRLIIYEAYNPVEKRLYTIYEEPYSEAVKIVKSTQTLGFLLKDKS